MLTYAPRRPSKPAPFLVLALLALLLGPICWTGTVRAQFHFRDYEGAHPVLTPPDEIRARAALLIDNNTGEVLYARNPDAHLLPASTTKLMTALVVYKKIGLNGDVTVIDEDHAEPSYVPLVTGETISVNKLFHALLIESANDAARALGRDVAGSNDAFVAMMNEQALAMGCFNTHFANPNGLPAPYGTHYTSCADLMRIFKAVIAYPELRQICQTKEYVMHSASGTHVYHNHNLLLGNYPGMGPAKTGWTVASRHTYAAAVVRGNRELLLTLLDSPNKWVDAQILFNWGFAQAPSNSASNAAAPGDTTSR